MKKTKFLVVLMSAILFLSACGGNNPTPSGDDSSTQGESQVESQGESQVSSEESSEVSSSEPEKPTLTFHTDGGTPIAVVTGEIGEAIDYSKYVTTWEDHDFIGWYGDERASKRKPEEFKEGNQDVYALWSGEIFQGAVDLVYFGRYPSSKVEDKALINEFTTKGEKSSWSSFSFANARYTYEGKSYVEMKESGVSSYFLEEPLLWEVGREWSQEAGFYTLRSREIIDVSWIDPAPRSDAWNNFSISSMYYDLNHGFKNVAFNDFEENRLDADVTLVESGSAFSGTDYAIYRGAIKNSCEFWYRTPSKTNYYWKMNSDEGASEDLMTNESGVVPEIAVDLRVRDYFTFTFDTNGGTPMEDQFVEAIRGEEVVLLECASTKEGYGFIGYFYDKECTREYDGHPTESSTTIYLGWAEKVTYTFKFNTNGGTPIEDQVTEGLRGGTVELQEYPHTSDDYEFAGYYYDKECTREYDNKPTELVTTIYIKYRSNVTYHFNISSVKNNASNPISVYSNGTYELYEPINENPYYKFNSWCLDEELTQPVTELKDITKNVDLYAKWDKTNWALLDCEYTLLNDDTYMIKGFKYNKFIADLVIPDTYNGKPVTAIRDYAFSLQALTSVTLGANIKTIGEHAFYQCNQITSLTVNDKLETIRAKAFYECTQMEVSSLPNTLVKIETYAFYNCYRLEVPSLSGESLERIETYAFYNCKGPKTFNVSSSLNMIGAYAFYNNSSLETLTFNEESTLPQIYKYTFQNTGIKSLKLPSSIETLYDYAFADCTSLETIELSDGLTTIDINVFSNCSSLKSIVIPDTVTYVGSSVFAGCSSLESITAPFVGLREYTNQDYYQYPLGIWFGKNSYDGASAHYQSYKGESATYYIPNSLKKVVVTKAKTIYGGAFFNCSMLEVIELPETLETIGLTSHDIFNGISNDCKVYYHETLDDYCGLSVPAATGTFTASPLRGVYNFYYIDENGEEEYGNNKYTLLTKIIVPASTDDISLAMFVGSPAITEIVVSDGVTSIPVNLFKGFTGIKTLTLPYIGTSPEEDTYLGYLFGATKTADSGKYVPSSLEKVILSDACTSLAPYAFANTNIKEVVFSKNLTSIPDYAFSGCTKLTTIVIPDTIETIGEYAFNGCTSLDSVNIPNSVTIISNVMFGGCTALESITIPETVTKIGEFAFSGCSGLKSITLPASVGTIGQRAFRNCTSLETVEILGNVYYIETETFLNCTSLVNFTLPTTMYSIKDYAFKNCSSLTSITITPPFNSLGIEAFCNCTSLTTVNFDGTTTQWSKISKGVRDFYGAGTTVVHCVNGTVSL